MPVRKRPSGYSARAWRAPKPEITFLYVIKAGDFVKVGISSNVLARLSQITSSCPLEVKFVAKRRIPTDRANRAEWLAHQLLAFYHHRAEWFNATSQQAITAITIAAQCARRVGDLWYENPPKPTMRAVAVQADLEITTTI